ncbi:MAG: hypothetical protein WD069_10450 [Planctomycetales bacterium]
MRSVRKFAYLLMFAVALTALSTVGKADPPVIDTTAGRGNPTADDFVAQVRLQTLRGEIGMAQRALHRNDEVRNRLQEALDGKRDAGELTKEELQDLLRQHEFERNQIQAKLKSQTERMRQLEGMERLTGDLRKTPAPQSPRAGETSRPLVAQALKHLETARRPSGELREKPAAAPEVIRTRVEGARKHLRDSAERGAASTQQLHEALERNAAERERLEWALLLAQKQQREAEGLRAADDGEKTPRAKKEGPKEGYDAAAIRELQQAVRDLRAEIQDVRFDLQALQKSIPRPDLPRKEFRAPQKEHK